MERNIYNFVDLSKKFRVNSIYLKFYMNQMLYMVVNNYFRQINFSLNFRNWCKIGYNFYYNKSLYLTFLQNLINIYIGLVCGYFVELITIGVGYKFGKILDYNCICLALGYSHNLYYNLKSSMAFKCLKNYLLLFGRSKKDVRDVGLQIRGLRSPDKYKGKGVRFLAEFIKLREKRQRK